MNGKDKDGFTALHLAAESGHESTCKLLIEKHAVVDATTDVGFTPLNLACKSANDGVVKVLLAAGSNLEQADTAYGCTGASRRALLTHALCVHCRLTPSSPPCAALLWAVQYCGPATVAALAAAGARLEVKSRFGSTPLMLASEAGQLEKVRILLAAGANPATKDSRGASAQSKARERNHRVVVEELEAALVKMGLGTPGAKVPQSASSSSLPTVVVKAPVPKTVAGRIALAAAERAAEAAAAEAAAAEAAEAAEKAARDRIAKQASGAKEEAARKVKNAAALAAKQAATAAATAARTPVLNGDAGGSRRVLRKSLT